MVGGLCGLRPVTLFDTAEFRSRIAGEVDLFDLQGRFTPWQRRRWSRSEQLAVLAAAEALDESGLLDERHRSRAGRRAARRRHRRPAAQRGLLLHADHRRSRSRAADADLPSLLERAGRRRRVPFRPAGRALVRRRGLLVEHDCHRSRRRAHHGRRARRRGLRRRRRAVAAHLQRLQRAAADGSRALPAVRCQPCRHEHRRGRGDARARGHGSRPAARRDDLRRAGRLRALLRGLPSDRARARGPRHRVDDPRAASRRRGSTQTRSITSTATAPRRRRTTRPKRAACTSSSASAPGACRSTRSSRWSATASAPPARSRRRRWR